MNHKFIGGNGSGGHPIQIPVVQRPALDSNSDIFRQFPVFAPYQTLSIAYKYTTLLVSYTIFKIPKHIWKNDDVIGEITITVKETYIIQKHLVNK